MNENKDQDSLLEEHLEEITSMEGYDKPVRNARMILFVIAALQLLPIILFTDSSREEYIANIIICVVVALIFVGLALWTKKKPFTAIVVALVVYSALLLLNFILEPITIFQGIFMKIAVYVLLIVSLKNAREVQIWMDSVKKK